ncbi:MAG: CoA transferase, partial [Acidimicrobiales bacterium]
MVDGTAILMSMIHAFTAMGLWQEVPGTNLLDTGAPFYDVYETADGRFIAVGAIESQFYAELLERSGLAAEAGEDLPSQMDRTRWPETKQRYAELFLSRTRDEWCALLEGTDACVAPVLSMAEAPSHPHNAARGTFLTRDGIVQPAPAPRFSRTPAGLGHLPPAPGEHTAEVLASWGFEPSEVSKLMESGAVA